MQRIVRAIVLTFIFFSLALSIVSAHGEHTVGDYSVVFGWQNEPAYAGLENGPEVILSLVHDEDAPFPLDVDVNLRARVSFGPASKTIFFEWVRGEPGHYTARLIPTMPGDYVFHLTGTIGDTAVDLTFDSADGEFSSVEPAADILFPAPNIDAAATIVALEARLDALEARIAALEGQ